MTARLRSASYPVMFCDYSVDLVRARSRSYNVFMKRNGIISFAFLLAACGIAGDKQDQSSQPQNPAAAQKLAVSPSFSNLAGRWRSASDSLGDGRFMVLDIASDGSFTMEARSMDGKSEQVLESVRGKAEASGSVMSGSLTDKPGAGKSLAPFASWTARVSGEGSSRSAEMSGAGKSVSLRWQHL